MSIIERRFTYKGRIKVSTKDLALARSGGKTCTIRLGKLAVARDITYLSDGRDSLKVKIVKVDSDRVYGDFTDADARLDGLESMRELDEDLRRYYRSIDPMQPMTVIHFQPVDS